MSVAAILEPAAAQARESIGDDRAVQLSTAISLRRIADALEGAPAPGARLGFAKSVGVEIRDAIKTAVHQVLPYVRGATR